LRLLHQLREDDGVDGLVVQHQRVARPTGDQDSGGRAWASARFERPAQPRDVGLQRDLGLRRRLVAPHQVHEALAGHRGRARGDQHRQDGALLAASHVDRLVAEEDLEAAEDPDLHVHAGTVRPRLCKSRSVPVQVADRTVE
jgi:hypothetical protein